jgi:hypothetical protein
MSEDRRKIEEGRIGMGKGWQKRLRTKKNREKGGW